MKNSTRRNWLDRKRTNTCHLMRFRWVGIVAPLLLLAALAACSSNSSYPTETSTGPNGIVGKGGGDPFWEQIANKAQTGGVDAVIAWAESFESGKANAGVSYRYAGYCLEFVANAYGASYSNPYDTAWDMGRSLSLHDPHNPGAAPRGALMFFDLTSKHVVEGHVGISVGGGQMLSALTHATPGNTNVYTLKISSSPSDYWGGTYRGWAWPPASWGPLARQANGSTTTVGGGNTNGKGLYETTGSVAHAWADYTNASGTQGSSIAAYQTVLIACKVTGFKVADGNTWWYRIAQSPWNNAFYASADAFYNNGQTSGSLIGTPWVDLNVPNCGQSPTVTPTSTPTKPAPTPTKPTPTPMPTKPTVTPIPPSPTPTFTPPPPHLYAETTGGVTHTWTDYTNAGGTQGSSIAAYQTVLIACKVTGFKVADGNTWWYRVAQSPWNNAFYASADAFYNNGQTSGSLIGTPWVDPAVPNC